MGTEGPTLHLCHPFTARAVGWADEAALPEFHSAPHTRALRHLVASRGARCIVSYFTDEKIPRRLDVDGLSYRYWPRSFRTAGTSDRFRREWSMTELLHEAVRPSDVTIINTSGHGGRFSQFHGRLLRARQRPYVAMIGGAAATTTGAQREFLEHAAVVALHNRSLRERLVSDGLSSSRVALVPLGVDVTEQFTPAESARADSPTLLFVGRVLELKGLHTVVGALPAMAVALPEIALRLAGPEPDASYSASLRELASRLGVSDRLTFLGPLPRRELVGEYRRASLTVLPSQDEGFGMVVAESMACGTPVLAVEGSPGPTDMITSGEDGLLVSPDDFAMAITGLLRDPTRLAHFGQAARATAVARLSSAVTNACFEDLLERSLAAG